tara:strand:+ start:428 stop:766 length:339 start_codon:yes stop_codon:yes gene_type:complete
MSWFRRKKVNNKEQTERELSREEQKLERMHQTRANIQYCVRQQNVTAANIAGANGAYSYNVSSKLAEAAVKQVQGKEQQCRDKLLEAAATANNEEESTLAKIKRLRLELAAM